MLQYYHTSKFDGTILPVIIELNKMKLPLTLILFIFPRETVFNDQSKSLENPFVPGLQIINPIYSELL